MFLFIMIMLETVKMNDREFPSKKSHDFRKESDIDKNILLNKLGLWLSTNN